jgi:hypothetical protein
MKKAFALIALVCVAQPVLAQKKLYLDEIRKAAEKGWADNPEIIRRWKETSRPSVLWGYDAPANPVYLAAVLAFLHQETGDPKDAQRAAQLLSTYGDLREVLPKDYGKTRVEYAGGVPSLSNFFYLPPYTRAYLLLRGSDVLDDRTRQKIEREVAQSVDFIFQFPEWGAHNRAMLRAESLYYAALAMPGHPNAPRWKRMAEVISGDSFGHWEIEDTSLYSPVWLHALFSYADAATLPEAYGGPLMRYTLQYFTRLMSPSSTIPDYGDAWWNSASGALRFVAIFEKGASTCRSGEMKWAARSVFDAAKSRAAVLGVGDAYSLVDAYRWADESIAPVKPSGGSQEVLDDIVGKKIVFRDGWEPSSTYCLLNYRDEGDGDWLGREYLRRTLSVEEEKMHHGHADENSIALLMSGGSILLHDGGYRDELPSGQYGAYRQDYFHNRVIARKNKRDKSQPLLEFVRNSGAYRPVRTQKIDFLKLQDVDMSRTRLVDDNLGYQWDRVVTFVRSEGFFVVIDAIKATVPDFFTFASLWHAQKILSRGEHYYDIATDSVPGFHFSPSRSLLIYFPQQYAKSEGVEPIRRHNQDEQVVYQSVSSQYRAGDTETFVTVLVPHERTAKPDLDPPRFRMIPVSTSSQGVALEIRRSDARSYLFVKTDLDAELSRDNIRPRYTYDLGRLRFGDFETDAHYLCATMKGEKVRYSASNVIKVLLRGQSLFEALPYTYPLQLDGGPDRVGFTKWRYWEDEVIVKR